MHLADASGAEKTKSDSHFYLPGFGTNEPNKNQDGIFIPSSEGGVKPPAFHNFKIHIAKMAYLWTDFSETASQFSRSCAKDGISPTGERDPCN
ncbi:hypothetical protein RRH01S_01_00060 [Rhizobium rhizogenes NBRC 13257]|uniref:Uncharacterized protein n=1 Tax=Rhizobium rhizogenes NBRC 13257 TaxID=1220581 RepID=A0AA87PUF9_RHIRH|nr:hypothetical protein RRH01S_01_00060 [Rhizobium rhizogenes NBRC 13257]